MVLLLIILMFMLFFSYLVINSQKKVKDFLF